VRAAETAVFSGKRDWRPDSAGVLYRARGPGIVRPRYVKYRRNGEMGTIQCLIFIAGQTAARSAFRRKGPICARPLEWVPLLPAGRPAGRPVERRRAFSSFHFPENTPARPCKMHPRERKRPFLQTCEVLRALMDSQIRCVIRRLAARPALHVGWRAIVRLLSLRYCLRYCCCYYYYYYYYYNRSGAANLRSCDRALRRTTPPKRRESRRVEFN